MSLLAKKEDSLLQRLMSKFLTDRLNEILKESAEEGKEVVFILVTRKGYWTYRLLKEKIFENIKSSGVELKIVSDRYVLKDFEFKSIKGKNVFVFDDTINNGNNMFFYYSLFDTKGANRVIPCVYAVSTEYLKKCQENEIQDKIDLMKYLEYERVVRDKELTEEEIREKAKEIYKRFCNELKYGEIMTPDDISRLSIRQLNWVYDNLAPFVMDLPMFVYEEENPEKKYISFTKNEWDRLCQKTEDWEFEDNVFEDAVLTLKSAFFRLNNSLLDEQLDNNFFDFVVKCKYKMDGEEVRATFVPFAIVCSFSYADIWRYFEILYKDTAYYSFILETIQLEDTIEKISGNHNLGRALMRAVIYSLSMYIGALFKEKVRMCTGKEIMQDMDIIEQNNVGEFRQTLEEEWRDFDRDAYENKLLLCEAHDKILPINLEPITEGECGVASAKAVEQSIHDRIIKTRYREKSMKEKILTLETINELENEFIFSDKNEKKNDITKAVLLLMDCSCIGNEILLDNEKRVIYRGFRAGENCELLFSKEFLWVYVYAYALYHLKGANGYREHIEEELNRVLIFFRQREYFPRLLSEKNFMIYKKYFIYLENPDEQIQNKEYLLDHYVDGSMCAGEKLLIDEAFSNVKEWML